MRPDHESVFFLQVMALDAEDQASVDNNISLEEGPIFLPHTTPVTYNCNILLSHSQKFKGKLGTSP